MTHAQFDLLRIRDETFVREVDFHWTIESTNTQAAIAATDSQTPLPLLVLAERQTRGRGRGGNQWLANPGALTFSVVVPLEAIDRDRIPQVSLASGLAVCRAVERLAPAADLGLKWPNDVYLGTRKLAGILIELPHHSAPRCVIGIGLNVNNALDDSLSQTATSLSVAAAQALPLTDVLIACLTELEYCLHELQRDADGQTEQWRAYDYLYGRDVEISLFGKTIRGVAAGIEPNGALRLQTADGVQTCAGGVVRML